MPFIQFSLMLMFSFFLFILQLFVPFFTFWEISSIFSLNIFSCILYFILSFLRPFSCSVIILFYSIPFLLCGYYIAYLSEDTNHSLYLLLHTLFLLVDFLKCLIISDCPFMFKCETLSNMKEHEWTCISREDLLTSKTYTWWLCEDTTF